MMTRSFPHLALAAVLLASCGGPSGLLGVRWGDDSTVAARKLRIDCSTWNQWDGQHGFDECEDWTHLVDAFGRRAAAHLFRAGNRIEGLALEFPGCRDDPQLDKVIRDKFGIEESKLPYYKVYWGNGVVHYERSDAANNCMLTVGGGRFGEAFQTYQLGIGLRDLSAGLRPR